MALGAQGPQSLDGPGLVEVRPHKIAPLKQFGAVDICKEQDRQ